MSYTRSNYSGGQAEGIQAEVLGTPTFGLQPKFLQPVLAAFSLHT